MSRRQYDIRFPCAEPGCQEHSWMTASTRRDEQETRAFYAKNPWRCTRHRHPEEVLSVDNRERTTVVTADRVRQSPNWRRPDEEMPYLDGLYWGGTAGLEIGRGFKAYAKDFPPGTRLIITARIELPESENGQ